MRPARERHEPGEMADRTSQAPPTSTASVMSSRRQIVRRRRSHRPAAVAVRPLRRRSAGIPALRLAACCCASTAGTMMRGSNPPPPVLPMVVAPLHRSSRDPWRKARAERPARVESAPVERRGSHTRNRYGLWRAAHPAAATDRQKSARTITARVLQQLPSSPAVLSQPPGSSSDRARLRRGLDSSGPAFPLTSSWCMGPMVGARRADRQGSLVTHTPEPSAGRRRCTLAGIHLRADSGDNAPMSSLRTLGHLVAATRA